MAKILRWTGIAACEMVTPTMVTCTEPHPCTDDIMPFVFHPGRDVPLVFMKSIPVPLIRMVLTSKPWANI